MVIEAVNNSLMQFYQRLLAVRLPIGENMLVTVNFSDTQSQCYIRLPFARNFAAHTVCLQDLMSIARYERGIDELVSRGLYLDLLPWRYHIFEVEASWFLFNS